MGYIGRTTDGFGVRQRFVFTPNAGTTSISGTDANGATLTFSDSVYMDVFLNGVLLKAGTDYNTNTANTIAGLTATVANDEVTVLVYDIFTTADMVSATSGGTFTGNVAVDTDTLFADATNDKVGINNASPNHELQINGNSTTSSLSLKTSATGNTTSDGLELKVQGDSAAYLYNYENAMLRFGTNGLERVRIDANGHVTMQSQTAFSVHRNSTNISNITPGSNSSIVFDNERFDQNADYNTSNGTFTAPVTGKYLLTLQLRIDQVDTGATYYIPFIETSNEMYRDIIDPEFSSDPSFISQHVTIIADMDENDTATTGIVQSGGATQTDINGNPEYTYFSGVLIC